MDIDNADWISTSDAAALTGYTQEYVRILSPSGKIVTKKIFHTTLVSKSSILEYKHSKEGR